MTSITDPRDFSRRQPVVNYDEPTRQPPPLLAVGPLAWIRKNLLSSWLDVVLTVIGAAIAITAVVSFVQWAVQAANWFVINFNLRGFMIGRFEPEAEWRVQLLTLIIAFVAGFAIAAWTRISWRVLVIVAVLLAFLFVVPPLVQAVVPRPATYLAAGSAPVATGSASETPQQQVAFIAAAGESVTIQLADQYSQSDADAATLYGFGDRATNTVRNAAANRLRTNARLAEIDRLLAGDALTAAQRERLVLERERVTAVEPIADTYALNESPVNVRILRGTTLEPVAEAKLEPGGEALQVTIPENGWYVVEKTVAQEGSVAVLETRGIYPHVERTFILTAGEGSTQVAGRGEEYVRMTDSFTISDPRPSVDGTNVPMLLITDADYRGQHSLGDFLRVYLAPFLDQINEAFLFIVIAVVIGYRAARVADRLIVVEDHPQATSRRWAGWMLFVLPVVMFALIYGVPGILPLTDTRRWGGLMLTILLTIVGIVASFPLGVLLALGRRSELPAIKYFCTLYIEFVRGVPLITVLFMAQLLVPLINPSLAEFPNVFRAMVGITLFSAAYLAENVRGGLQAVNPGQVEAAKALGLHNYQITLYITLPQALRAVIPALVGQFISLFKDTSLVAIVGLLDLLGMGDSILTQTEYIGLRREVFVFIVVIYFVFSYSMAVVSRRIEATGSGAMSARQL
jgi:His/Glu/Gln/Arg/opine family amino acid ABC transporter permease subunit